MTESPEILASGAVVASRFVVREVLGIGGMGVVYRATQSALDRDVALKVIRPEHASSEGARRRFMREARVAAALRHPNAVRIVDFGEHEHTLFIAMELLRGRPLRTIVDRDLPPLELRRACALGRQIADVLAAAASIELVHRDLKPENIMVERDGDGGERAVVVDFGLAFRAEHTPETGRITSEGMASGTPDYMAPEQVRGQVCTPATDVYAFGCVLYEMLTATSPLATRNPALTLTRQLFTSPLPIREAHPELGIPAAIDELVLAMLAKQPSDRPSAATVRDALRRFEVGLPERMGPNAEDGRALGRASRMLSEHPTQSAEHAELAAPASAELKRVVFVGVDVAEELETGLAANGLARVAPGEAADAVLALADEGASVQSALGLGLPVVVVAHASIPPAVLAEWLRAGVADVAPHGADVSVLVRKLHRAIRRAHRRG